MDYCERSTSVTRTNRTTAACMATTNKPGVGNSHITAARATSGLGRPHEPALEQLVDGATTV